MTKGTMFFLGLAAGVITPTMIAAVPFLNEISDGAFGEPEIVQTSGSKFTVQLTAHGWPARQLIADRRVYELAVYVRQRDPQVHDCNELECWETAPEKVEAIAFKPDALSIAKAPTVYLRVPLDCKDTFSRVRNHSIIWKPIDWAHSEVIARGYFKWFGNRTATSPLLSEAATYCSARH